MEEPYVRKICRVLSGRLFPHGRSMRISQLVRMKETHHAYKCHIKQVQQEMKTMRRWTYLMKLQNLANEQLHEQSRSLTKTHLPAGPVLSSSPSARSATAVRRYFLSMGFSCIRKSVSIIDMPRYNI